MAATLYLLRHGHIDAQSIFVGQADVPLSATGRQQAVSLQHALAAVPFTATWCSPLQRCRETASIILEAHPACPLVIEENLREVSLGTWEGKEKNWVRHHETAAWQQRGNTMFHYAPPQGESLHSLTIRILPVFLAVCRTAQQHHASLLVAHRSVNQAILAHCMALQQEHMVHIAQPYGAVTAISLDTVTATKSPG